MAGGSISPGPHQSSDIWYKMYIEHVIIYVTMQECCRWRAHFNGSSNKNQSTKQSIYSNDFDRCFPPHRLSIKFYLEWQLKDARLKYGFDINDIQFYKIKEIIMKLLELVLYLQHKTILCKVNEFRFVSFFCFTILYFFLQ